MKRCIIGMTPTDILDAIHKPWIEDNNNAFLGAGAVPLALSFTWNRECVAAQLELVDGVYLSGGACDIQPGCYGEENNGARGCCPERDDFEMLVVQEAMRLDKPILGVCRGAQVLNVFSGGSLVQDIRGGGHSETYHSVGILDGKLKELFGAGIIRTNSFHHEAVGRVAPGFIVTARAADGTVEAIENPHVRFAMGIQWHPEVMLRTDNDEFSRKIFAAFVDACRCEG